LSKIPKLKFKQKPDWNRPETLASSNVDYYESQRAIGKLFREIKLPALEKVRRVWRHQRHHLRQEDTDEDSLVNRLERTAIADIVDDIDQAVCDRISQFIRPEIDDDYMVHVSQLFDIYASSLRTICTSNALSFARDAMLTEEEAVIGTIVAKSSQPRRRKDMMSKLREQTSSLVKTIRHDLAGDEDHFAGNENYARETALRHAWTCWRLTLMEKDTFGAQSLGFIALGMIFDTIKAIEDDEKRWL
jgi:RNA-dependent RNA polymerase